MYIREVSINGRQNPIGIDTQIPHISWKTESTTSKFQHAYQIQVSKNPLFQPVFFDSGKVTSSIQAHIPYTGPALDSKTTYYLRLRIWNEDDVPCEYSDTQTWETGLMGGPFFGKWIEPEQLAGVEEKEPAHMGEVFMPFEYVPPEEKLRPCQYIRKVFSTAVKAIRTARLYASAHGVYQLFLNGDRLDQGFFAPELTSFPNRLFYQTYDVTKSLQTNDNVWGVVLADGWHIGRIGLTGDSCQYASKLAFIGQIEICYEDGTIETIISDESFVSAVGKHVYSDFFIGEMQDGRLALDEFSSPLLNTNHWLPVTVKDYATTVLTGQSRPPVKIVERISAVAKATSPKGETILDFGKCLSGVVSMKVKGESGTKVVLDFCEALDQDGNYFQHVMGRNKDQRDIYILSGRGEEVFTPDFTYHGFRYVRVEGYPGEVELCNFEALVYATDLQPTLKFETSSEAINQLQRNIFNSQLGNMISVPTDCPTREKAAFPGDTQAFAITGCYNMDLLYFLKDWLWDVRVEQLPNGEITNFVPYYPKMKRMMDRNARSHSSAGWGDGCIIIPWLLYRQYGDLSVLRENYVAMKGWVAYVEKEAPEYLWKDSRHFGDWLTPSLTAQGMTISEEYADMRYILATCFFAQSASLLSEIAGLLGYDQDQADYHELSNKIKKAFEEAFIIDQKLTADLQGMYVLALAMKMVSTEVEKALLLRLVELIEANNYCLDTGVMSVRFLLPVLVEYGYSDIAARILFQRACPSWLYQIDCGATSIWEKMDAIKPPGEVLRTSFNHFMWGSVGEFLYEYAAGLRPLKPGFEEFELRPNLDLGFDWINIRYESIRGTIQFSYRLSGDQIHIFVEIPFNTRARIEIANLEKVLDCGQYEWTWNLKDVRKTR